MENLPSNAPSEKPATKPTLRNTPSELLALREEVQPGAERLPSWVVKRSDWGAEPMKNPEKATFYPEPLSKVLKFIVVHHSDEPVQLGAKGIQEAQMARGFDDVAYHFVLSADGTVYEGRPLNIVGGHAGQSLEANNAHEPFLDPDYGAIGVLLEGRFDGSNEAGHNPTPQQTAALIKLLQHLQSSYKIPPKNIIRHTDVKAALVEAKGLTFTGNETVCPGTLNLAQVKQTLADSPISPSR